MVPVSATASCVELGAFLFAFHRAEVCGDNVKSLFLQSWQGKTTP